MTGCASGPGRHRAAAVLVRGEQLIATACKAEVLHASLREDIDAWRPLAIATDFD